MDAESGRKTRYVYTDEIKAKAVEISTSFFNNSLYVNPGEMQKIFFLNSYQDSSDLQEVSIDIRI